MAVLPGDPDPNEPAYYRKGYTSTGCSNGQGFISLYDIVTDDKVVLYVYLYLDSVLIAQERFSQNTTYGGHVFAGLANGAYTITYEPRTADDLPNETVTVALDCEPVAEVPPQAIECVATYPFTVDIPRNVKYVLELEQLDGTVHRTEWLEKGYTGPPIDLCGSHNPARFEWPGTGNKIDVLHGSGATFELLVQNDDNLLRDFFTADERKFLVRHFRNRALLWTGWHLPDIYSTPWVSRTFHGTIQAYDGLASLGNRKYLNAAGMRYYGRARGIDIIFRCLRLLDLDLPVYLSVNVWEDTTDLNMEPLSQVYFDQEGYYSEENEPLTCKEVVERILKPYGAFIRQASGTWHIMRYDQVQGPYERRLAHIGKDDTEVVVEPASEPFEELATILADSETAYRDAVQSLNATPAFKQVTTVTNYGEYENFILNGNLQNWTGHTPLHWELPEADQLVIERYSNGESMVMRVVQLPQSTRGTAPLSGMYLRSADYGFLVQSKVGFQFSFDYQVSIEDYLPMAGVYWEIFPTFTLTGNVLQLVNPDTEEATAYWNGVTRTYASQTIHGSIPVPGNDDTKRIDVVYALEGSIVYQVGTPTAFLAADLVPEFPDNGLLITFITWEGAKAHFGSVSSAWQLEFHYKLRIGEYLARKRRYTSTDYNYDGRTRGPQQGYAPELVVDNPNEVGQWLLTAGNTSNPTRFMLNGLQGADGYFSTKGTHTFYLDPLEVAGLPELLFSVLNMKRSTMRGVTITLDNFKFQERDLGTERMLITGENEGQINTPPFEMDLHHGSGIPRTQALITLADGTPAKQFNGQEYLQEVTARALLRQHSRSPLVLSANVTAGVSPIAVLKDMDLPNQRFFTDKYIYHALRGIVEVGAIEVFGGENEVIPENAMRYEDGTPMLYEDGTFMLYEG